MQKATADDLKTDRSFESLKSSVFDSDSDYESIEESSSGSSE
jgi:hypothetical protein